MVMRKIKADGLTFFPSSSSFLECQQSAYPDPRWAGYTLPRLIRRVSYMSENSTHFFIGSSKDTQIILQVDIDPIQTTVRIVLHIL